MSANHGISGISKIITNQLQRGFYLANSSFKLQETLQHPDRIVSVSIPYNNTTIQGYRVQHNNLLGPYKGGIRIASHVNPELLSSLAKWMTIKCSLMELPLGGGKGGICLDPEGVSPSEMKRIIDAYTRGISPVIGGDMDIPAPDINTTAQMMDWMVNAYRDSTGVYDKNVVTGKTIDYGGLAGRMEATGNGAYQALHSYLNLSEESCKQIDFCIQGLGNVGYHLAKKLIDNGYRMVGAGDLRGYYANPSGLSLSSLVDNSESVDVAISREDFFKTPCDVMILAASQLQVDKEVSQNLQTSIVLEAANGPLDTEADLVCKERDIVVIPDILVNSGGVQASYYEMLQTDDTWDVDVVNQRLDYKMDKIITDVVQRQQRLQQQFREEVTLRDASYVIALENLESVLRA